MHLIRRGLRAIARHTPYLRRVVAQRDGLIASQGCFPPGHYYSPIPSADDVREWAPAFYSQRKVKSIPGVELDEPGQLHVLESLEELYADQPFSPAGQGPRRYRPDNVSYGVADAILLGCMIRHLRPARIIEVGCGNSSCAILDTNELFLENRVACTFIDPNLDRLLSLLRADDRDRHEIVSARLQDIDVARFFALAAGDILCIDSSHISRLGSDVNRLFFEILPRIQAGVHIHIHDIFYPFDYPRSWLDRGVYYNEAYVLKAFLQYNTAFRIVYWNQFMALFHPERLRSTMPLCVDDPGAAIWIRRT